MCLKRLVGRLGVATKKEMEREYERESFHARIEMEQNEQASLQARLKALEIKVKNEARIR